MKCIKETENKYQNNTCPRGLCLASVLCFWTTWTAKDRDKI